MANVIAILLSVMCWTNLSTAQETGTNEDGGVVDFRARLDSVATDIDLLKKDIRDLKDIVSLLGAVPILEEREVTEHDIQALKDDIEELKETIARGESTADIESVPLPEELLVEELLPEEEDSNWEEIAFALIIVAVVSQLAFWSGVYWRERRLRTRKGRTGYPTESEAGEEEMETSEEGKPDSVSMEDDKKALEPVHEDPRTERKRVLAPALCFVGGILIILFAMKEVATFIDITALIVVFAGSLLFTMTHFSLRDIVGAVRHAVGGVGLEVKEAEQARWVFKTLDNYVLGLGVLGFFIGLIVMLKNMDDPAQIGPGMALALLSILYAVGFSKIVIMPLELRIVRRLEAPASSFESSGASGRNTGLLLSVMVSLMAALLFFALLLSFSSDS